MCSTSSPSNNSDRRSEGWLCSVPFHGPSGQAHDLHTLYIYYCSAIGEHRKALAHVTKLAKIEPMSSDQESINLRKQVVADIEEVKKEQRRRDGANAENLKLHFGQAKGQTTTGC